MSSFKAVFTSYLQHKYVCSLDGPNPFSVPASFYLLFKDIASIKHELFADSLNQTGMLPQFCSKDPTDQNFGSSGTWHDVEDKVIGVAGHPPFNENFLISLLEAVGATYYLVSRISESFSFLSTRTLRCVR